LKLEQAFAPATKVFFARLRDDLQERLRRRSLQLHDMKPVYQQRSSRSNFLQRC